MKRISLRQGKDELISTSGNHLCGLLVRSLSRGHDGYAPIFAYIGTEGYMLNQELRPGKQHCQSGTPVFLRQLSKKPKHKHI